MAIWIRMIWWQRKKCILFWILENQRFRKVYLLVAWVVWLIVVMKCLSPMMEQALGRYNSSIYKTKFISTEWPYQFSVDFSPWCNCFRHLPTTHWYPISNYTNHNNFFKIFTLKAKIIHLEVTWWKFTLPTSRWKNCGLKSLTHAYSIFSVCFIVFINYHALLQKGFIKATRCNIYRLNLLLKFILVSGWPNSKKDKSNRSSGKGLGICGRNGAHDTCIATLRQH